ncbi:MAG: divergent PAP2 family protein [Candidatus Gastranaerophilales bacterium]|nr:divergent PAP2 family protein [Candidatus Gastranaerophilales bacterium]
MYNTGLEAIFSGILSAFIAQSLKVISFIITHRKINFKIFTTTGGMPSSHSAGVASLTMSVGLIDGFTSVTFAVSLGFALVVIQDAQGLRRAAGKTAATLNRLVSEWNINREQAKPYEVLKELLGHTPLEVFVGIFLGVIISLFAHYVMPNIIDLSVCKAVLANPFQ